MRRPLALSLLLDLHRCSLHAKRRCARKPLPPVHRLFDTFGTLHREIDTKVPAAQRYFDQGLRLAYGFNHEAAGRAFAEAARLDPKCAMCVWGQALVLGPNINLPMAPELAADATTLASRAVQLSGNARPADRALIEALAKRYTTPAPADRKPLDEAYAKALADATRRFPDDDDIATLYAESLMDLSPWAYWSADGQPVQYTNDLVGALERVLQRNPDHIGAAHYYIHAVEASQDAAAGRALCRQAGLARAGFWAPGAHAGAHLHPHRPLPRRHADQLRRRAPRTRTSWRSAAAAMASIRWATCRTTGTSPR